MIKKVIVCLPATMIYSINVANRNGGVSDCLTAEPLKWC